MIAASTRASGGIAARLAAQARALADAAAESRARARRADTARWRDARLLWPLATKDTP